MRLAYFRAWSCRENEQKLWTTASLAKAAGWVGRVSAQSGVSCTKDRGLCFPRSSPSTPVLPKLPKCRRARARACARTQTLTHWDSRVRKALFDGPAKLPFPLGGPDAQPRSLNRKRAEPREKKMLPTLKIFYPLIFPVTHWEFCSGRPESLPNSEVPTTAPAKTATAP